MQLRFCSAQIKVVLFSFAQRLKNLKKKSEKKLKWLKSIKLLRHKSFNAKRKEIAFPLQYEMYMVLLKIMYICSIVIRTMKQKNGEDNAMCVPSTRHVCEIEIVDWDLKGIQNWKQFRLMIERWHVAI